MSAPTTTPKRTPLYDRHVQLGAKVIDFGGWAMPVQYSGIMDEHKAVREAAGLFDVSHMGEVIFSGPRAQEAVQKLTTNDVAKLKDGDAQYTTVCYPHGGIVDDCIVYRQTAERFLIIINASNIDKDVAWFKENAGNLCRIDDISPEMALLAVQGPKAVALVQSLTKAPVAELKSFTFCRAEVAGIDATVARTGYTGEDGFEILCSAASAPKMWDAIMSGGAAFGLKPIGLGARDTLRLEARLSLYGNDIDAEHSPLEAGLGWVVKGRGYIGEAALAAQKVKGLERKLVGFKMTERGTARHGYNIVDDSGKAIGVVTSGCPSPSLGVSIGLGYVPSALAEPGTTLRIDCRGKVARAEVVKGPFYKRPTNERK